MPIVPTLRLVLLAVLPLALGVAAAAAPALAGPMLGLDAALLLVAALDAALARRPLVSVTREPPRVFSVGRLNPVRLELQSRARRPLVVAVTDDRPEELPSSDLPATISLAPGARAGVTYHVRPARRGSFALGSHHLRYRSPLGLWQRQLRISARHPVRVYPDILAVRTYELLARQSRENLMVRAARLRGGENEFERLREYQRDDEFRAVDWKATARRQKLIAREYQQERNQTVVGLLDCGRLMTAETDGLSHLDHALNALLMMAHVAARGGDQIGLLAFDARVRTFLAPVGGRRTVNRVVEATYDLHPALVDPDFDEAFAHLSRRLRKRALVVLFTQVVDDVSARSVLRLLRGLPPRHLPLCVLFRDTEIERLVEPGPGAAPDLHVRAAAAEALLWRERLVRDLKAGGALVLHIPPREATPALVNRYLQIKAQHLL